MSLATKGRLAAPKGRFRVVGVDVWEIPGEDDVLIADAPDLPTAKRLADQHAGMCFPVYVYDSDGVLVYENPGQPPVRWRAG